MDIYMIVTIWLCISSFSAGVWAGHRAGWGSGHTDGYIVGCRDGTHGRTFKRVREGGAY